MDFIDPSWSELGPSFSMSLAICHFILALLGFFCMGAGDRYWAVWGFGDRTFGELGVRKSGFRSRGEERAYSRRSFPKLSLFLNGLCLCFWLFPDFYLLGFFFEV